jgi:hypothetical protein
VALTIVCLLGQALNLMLFHRTKRMGPSVAMTVVIGYVAVFGGILALGGLTEAPGNVGWGLLAPMGVILLLGGRAWLPTRSTQRPGWNRAAPPPASRSPRRPAGC